MRAADQSLGAVGANNPEEAVYLFNMTDDHNEPLTRRRLLEAGP